VSDVAVVTATRDGMNLVPYEYVVCRQGPEAAAAARQSMLVVSGKEGTLRPSITCFSFVCAGGGAVTW